MSVGRAANLVADGGQRSVDSPAVPLVGTRRSEPVLLCKRGRLVCEGALIGCGCAWNDRAFAPLVRAFQTRCLRSDQDVRELRRKVSACQEGALVRPDCAFHRVLGLKQSLLCLAILANRVNKAFQAASPGVCAPSPGVCGPSPGILGPFREVCAFLIVHGYAAVRALRTLWFAIINDVTACLLARVVSEGRRVGRDRPSSHFLPFLAFAEPSDDPPVRTRGGEPRVPSAHPCEDRRVGLFPRTPSRFARDCRRMRPCCRLQLAGLSALLAALARLLDRRVVLFRRPAGAGQVRPRGRCLCEPLLCPSRRRQD